MSGIPVMLFVSHSFSVVLSCLPVSTPVNQTCHADLSCTSCGFCQHTSQADLPKLFLCLPVSTPVKQTCHDVCVTSCGHFGLR